VNNEQLFFIKPNFKMKSLFILFVSVLLIIGISKAQNTVYGPIQIYGTYEGAAILKPSTTWKSVTQGQYNRVEEFFKEQVPSGMTREYYLAVRFADNIPGCSMYIPVMLTMYSGRC
jgi:hypothetical protein